MQHGFHVTMANFLFHRCFLIYDIIYSLYKSHKDKDIIQFLRREIKSGMTVVEIGANIGFFVILLSKLVGNNGMVFAFEPDHLNYRHLRRKTRGLKNVRLMNCAIGSSEGKIPLYRSKELNTRHQTFGEGGDFDLVDCFTLDSLVAEADFIKIDIEGYEYYALLGMGRLLKSNVMLLNEHVPELMKKAKVRLENYLGLLKDFDITFINQENFVARKKSQPRGIR